MGERHHISTRTATAVIGTATLAGLAVLAMAFDPRSDASTEVPPPLDAALMGTTPGLQLPESGYLAVGKTAPPLKAASWQSDPPQSAASYAGRLTLLDLWGAWCPYARELSPGLIQMREDFRDDSVEFVSLTVGTAPAAGHDSRGWISGYDPGASLVPFRCLFNDVTYGLAVHPTIYLIGSDGRVLWCDGGMREQHAEAADVERAVREAIKLALAELDSHAGSITPPQKPVGHADSESDLATSNAESPKPATP